MKNEKIRRKTKAMVLAIFVVAIMLTSVFPMVTADGGWCYEPVSKPDNGTNVDIFLIAEPGLVQTQLVSTFTLESQLDEQDVTNPPIRKSFVPPRKSVGDAEDVPLVEAEGSYTILMGPEYADYTQELWWSLRFDIYGGAVNGDGRTYADIGGLDEEGNFIIIGKVDVLYEFTGTYPGGLTESFADGAIEGTVSGTMNGVPFSGTAVGTWTGQVDAEAGTITGEVKWTITVDAGLTYPPSFDIDLDFEPIKPIAEIEFAASPSKLGVIELGTYCADLSLMAYDADGNSLPGRRISMATDPGGKLKAAELDKEIVITDGGGFARNKLCVEVDDIDALPYEAPIYLADELTPDGNWERSYTIERAVLEVSITSPQDEWEADTETFEVSGTVEADDLSKVSLTARIIPTDKEAEYECLPVITVDDAGSFSFPVSLLTPDMWYTILVEVKDENDHTHSAAIKVYYAASYYVEIVKVNYPEWVNPGDTINVNVSVRYATSVQDQLTVTVTLDGEEQSQTVEVNPTSSSHYKKHRQAFQRLADPPDQTETVDWNHKFPNPWDAEIKYLEITVKAVLKKSGNEHEVPAIWTEVRKLDYPITSKLTVQLPYPPLECLAEEDLCRDRLLWCKANKMMQPDWARKYGSPKGITFKANLHNHGSSKNSKNMVVSDAYIKIDRGPLAGWQKWQWLWLYYNDEEKLIPGADISFEETGIWNVHMKDVPVGVYTVTLYYRVKFEGSDLPPEQKTASTTFDVSKMIQSFKYMDLGVKGSESQSYRKDSRLGNTHVPALNQGETAVGQIPLTSGSVITLDWEDPHTDLDLHIIDPEGHILGVDYGRYGVRNTITGASYSGPDSKPEVVEFASVVQGDYTIHVYARVADNPATPTITIGKPTGICGDVNCDDVINIGDVTLLLNHWGDPVKYPLCNDWAGDVNSDDVINIGDVTLLLNHWGDPVKYPLNCG